MSYSDLTQDAWLAGLKAVDGNPAVSDPLMYIIMQRAILKSVSRWNEIPSSTYFNDLDHRTRTATDIAIRNRLTITSLPPDSSLSLSTEFPKFQNGRLAYWDTTEPPIFPVRYTNCWYDGRTTCADLGVDNKYLWVVPKRFKRKRKKPGWMVNEDGVTHLSAMATNSAISSQIVYEPLDKNYPWMLLRRRMTVGLCGSWVHGSL